ncbi:MAG: alpha-ketoacid dehydrogenase subunit beta [Desulfurococcales archaeon]|jgi:pyruvate dehydrogenase E1 component beta subunit|nr:alpha-ketoacid dehydrogenase subunit beta [Desulfurococcales archaeon]
MGERMITFAEALNEALDQMMAKDEKVIVMGEDVGVYGGVFGVTKGLIEKYGPERVRDTPIAESGFIGAGIGAAAVGYRPVVELMFIDFLGVAFDQIYNQAAKMRYMFGGRAKIPLVLRTVAGAGFSAAAQHSQSLHSIFVHVPGLKVVMPSTPYDAKGLLISSIKDDDPVIFIEHKGLYGIKGPVPKDEYEVPLGVADVKRRGKDVTIVATAAMVHKSLRVAEKLAKEGVDIEVVDPRSLKPLDLDTILGSIKKTGRLVVVDEGYPRCGFATDIAAIAASMAFRDLKAPVKLVTPPDTPVPFSPALEPEWIPSENDIEKAVRKTVED